MRALIYALVGLSVAAALLMFDDVDNALPLVNLIVWPTAGLAGLVLLIRSSSRRRRRSGSGRRDPAAQRPGLMLDDQRRSDLRLPRR